MGFFDRLSRLIRSNLNDLVGKAEDPVKILDQSMADMQEDLVKLRQAVLMAITSQKKLKNQSDQSELQIKTWYERAEVALRRGDDELAKKCLSRRKSFQDSSYSLTKQLQSQDGQVEKLKSSLLALEGKIGEIKTKKDMLKARAKAAQAQQQIENVVGNIGSNSAMAAFERMEEKIQSLEASSQAAAELAGADLESQFAEIEAGNDIDDELKLLKADILASSKNLALPESEKSNINIDDFINTENDIEIVDVSEVDNELKELKRNLKD